MTKRQMDLLIEKQCLQIAKDNHLSTFCYNNSCLLFVTNDTERNVNERKIQQVVVFFFSFFFSDLSFLNAMFMLTCRSQVSEFATDVSATAWLVIVGRYATLYLINPAFQFSSFHWSPSIDKPRMAGGIHRQDSGNIPESIGKTRMTPASFVKNTESYEVCRLK